MNTMKSLLPFLAAMAIAMTAFASSVMAAEDGVLRDTNGTVIANGTAINLKGWMKFETLGTGMECHLTSTVEATGSGTTGNVTSFAPDTTNCHGFGSIFNGCRLTSVSVTNLPWGLTITRTDIDIVTTSIIIHMIISNCTNPNVHFITFFFEEGITLKPLKTGTRSVTNTEGRLGTTGAAGEEFAGVELSGPGEAETDLGTLGVEASGELEVIGSARCTYKIT